MKKLIAIVAPVLFLFACNSVEKYRAGIEELTSQWDETTQMVTDFASTVQAEQASFNESLSSMALDESTMPAMKSDAKEQLMAAYGAWQDAGNGYGNITSELNSFVAEWTTKAEEVNNLKEGLANGKLEGDVSAKIAELTTMVTDAGTKLEGWKEQFATAQAAVNSQKEQFQTMFAEVMPAK